MIERLKNEPVILAALVVVAALVGTDLSEEQLAAVAGALAILVRARVTPARKG